MNRTLRDRLQGRSMHHKVLNMAMPHSRTQQTNVQTDLKRPVNLAIPNRFEAQVKQVPSRIPESSKIPQRRPVLRRKVSLLESLLEKLTLSKEDSTNLDEPSKLMQSMYIPKDNRRIPNRSLLPRMTSKKVPLPASRTKLNNTDKEKRAVEHQQKTFADNIAEDYAEQSNLDDEELSLVEVSFSSSIDTSMDSFLENERQAELEEQKTR